MRDWKQPIDLKELVTHFVFDSVKLSGLRSTELFGSSTRYGKSGEDTNMHAGGLSFSERFHLRGLGADLFYDKYSAPTLHDFSHFWGALEGEWSFAINNKVYCEGSLRSICAIDFTVKDDGAISMKQAPVPLRIPEKAFILEEPMVICPGTQMAANLSWPCSLRTDNPIKLYFYLLGTTERIAC